MTTTLNDILQEAIHYAQRGLPVFPCQVSDKSPLTRNGFKDASVNIEHIKCWWANHPSAIIGMPTGSASHVVVVDIDPRHGGDHALQGLIDQYGALPDTLTAITGGGGTHYYFKYPGHYVKCSTGKIGPGIDIKGDGGYVIVPPSGHESGNNYYWDGEFDLNLVADMPEWLLSLIHTDNTSTAPEAESSENPIPQGQRNHALASLAGTMRRVGMSYDEILAAILKVNENRCQPPLAESEVCQIAHSVCRYEPDTVAVAVTENHFDQMFRPEPCIADPGAIPEDLLHVPGFVQKVMTYNLDNAIRPQPVLALAGAIQLQAALAARKVCDARENRTNLYIIGVAGSGAGKEFARKINRRIFNVAGLSHLDGHDELASDAGLIKAI